MAQKDTKQSVGTIIGGFTLLGVGVGLLVGQASAGTIIGIALGLLVSAFIRMR